MAANSRSLSGKKPRAIKSLNCTNFTVFSDAYLKLRGLNIIVGENGTGKTHLLKLAYSVTAVGFEQQRRSTSSTISKSLLQSALADKLTNVFRPESLGRLARRRQGRERSDVAIRFNDANLDIDFGFSTNSKSEVTISKMPKSQIVDPAVFIPTRELLTIFPSFVSIYESRFLEFEETWRDTCILLGLPLQRGPKEARIKELLGPLETSMGGIIEADRSNGRFYLKTRTGRMEMPLVAEGLRKLGMIARLIATGALLDNGYLFWDEPEANLNPKLIKLVASTIVNLSLNGIQCFVATHSLFLLREIEIILAKNATSRANARFFALNASKDGVIVTQGPSIEDIGEISSLDEDLMQSDRFLEV